MKSTVHSSKLIEPLRNFADSLTQKYSAESDGHPEAQLKSPVEQLFLAYGKSIARKIVLKDESSIERLGRPDYAVECDGLLIGYIELKEPDKGANPDRYKGHDAEQWGRFKSIPNILYTCGNEWALYRNGELAEKRVQCAGDVCTDGRKAVNEDTAKDLFSLFALFTSWTPIVPHKPKELASFLAPFCRLIRDEVVDALKDPKSPMHSLKDEIKRLLFPDADDFRFADAYAQTVVFALLLAHLENADVLDLRNAYDVLEKHHSLLSRSLEFLTDKEARKEISTSLSLIQRVIHETPREALTATAETSDPWLFFYEDFLAAYDPKLRKESGVYYTPLEVVQCQVRLIDEILRKQFGKEMGFVEAGVATLDPAAGTGTYLLAIIDYALKRVEKEEGKGAVKGGARSLINNLHGFEWMVGPYAVAQLRFSQALTKYNVVLPETGTGVYLTNTLESPHVKPPAPPLFHRPIAQEHERALRVKDSQHVLVCLGNPPYGRHESAEKDGSNRETTGGWVRYGDGHDIPILESFLQPARDAGHGVHLKNLYNLYVYFMRWSLWKVFEHSSALGPGVVSFITASSYIDGDAFSGVREHLRKICDQVDVIDLGGEGRGTRKDENVFAIQTPVAIFVAWRKVRKKDDTPAVVRYTRIEGTREEKLSILAKTKSFSGFTWQNAPAGWQDPFRPATRGAFSEWPKIEDLFPWQNNGVMAGRTWIVAPSIDTLQRRLQALGQSSNRVKAFKNSPTGRKFDDAIRQLPPSGEKIIPLSKTSEYKSVKIGPYSHRSFDREFVLEDARFLDRSAPQLWQVNGASQIFLASMLCSPLGVGPGIVASANIPDKHFFSNRGAKDIIPLFLDGVSSNPNIVSGLLSQLGDVSAEDFAGYVYCVLAHPAYTRKFKDELVNREVRVPLTKNKKLFKEAAEFGKELIWLHTYGERLHSSKKRLKGKIPKGGARCAKAVPDTSEQYPNDYSYNEATETVTVGGGTFTPVSKTVWYFEVSGFKVVQSWLGYRMKDRKGKKSSPLDDIHPERWTYEFTWEFLELLWVLEKTIDGYPAQEKIFNRILASELYTAQELPPVPEEARKGPKMPKAKGETMEMWEEE